jgi:murein DD-endopeptidase MepM/ murein hydrolase activator NlpD
MKKRSNYYTFMFFPEGKGNPFTLRIHPYTFYLTIVSVLLIISGLALLLYKTGEISLKLQLVQGLKEENARLGEQNRDLQISADKIANIDSLAAYLQRLSAISGSGPAGGLPQPVASAQAAKDAPGVQPLVQVEDMTRESDGAQAQRGAQTVGEYASSVPNIMPVDGWITKHFVPDTEAEAHNGLDIAAASGTPIRATAMGAVDDIRNDKYFGLLVEIRHDNGFVTRYTHCSQVLVSVSDRVNRGQTIALVGNTGRSTAPHLHYEVLKFGKNVDPIGYTGADKQ